MRAPYETPSPLWGLVGLLISLVAALLLQGAAARLIGGAGLFPNLVLIALYVWSIRRPHFIAPPVLLIVGLVQDLFTGGPFGVWAVAYIVAFTVARDREADGLGGDIGPVAVRFAALAAIAQLVAWAAGSAAIAVPVPIGGLIAETILTILVCPLFTLAFARRRERSSFG
jgi:rod shape-determining protein MreD